MWDRQAAVMKTIGKIGESSEYQAKRIAAKNFGCAVQQISRRRSSVDWRGEKGLAPVIQAMCICLSRRTISSTPEKPVFRSLSSTTLIPSLLFPS